MRCTNRTIYDISMNFCNIVLWFVETCISAPSSVNLRTKSPPGIFYRYRKTYWHEVSYQNYIAHNTPGAPSGRCRSKKSSANSNFPYPKPPYPYLGTKKFVLWNSLLRMFEICHEYTQQCKTYTRRSTPDSNRIAVLHWVRGVLTLQFF